MSAGGAHVTARVLDETPDLPSARSATPAASAGRGVEDGSAAVRARLRVLHAGAAVAGAARL